MPLKVLFLTQGNHSRPSSRYRVYQLLQALRHRDIIPTILPRREAWRVRPADADVIFVQKGILPGLTSWWEEHFARRKPVVFDLDDAIWLPRRGGNPLLRALHREAAVQRVLRCATAVIAGNSYLAGYARRFNEHVTVVPSAIDLARYPATPPAGSRCKIGWIGSRTTLPYLKPLGPVFRQLGVTPLIIAAGDPRQLGFPVEFRLWSLEREVDDLRELGIGVAPLPDEPWERGKCGVKILQYMACGIPVVASPVGVQRDLVQDGVTGFLAETESQWCERLKQLLANPDLRARMGAAGRRRVEAEFNVEVAAAKVAEVLHSVVKAR